MTVEITKRGLLVLLKACAAIVDQGGIKVQKVRDVVLAVHLKSRNITAIQGALVEYRNDQRKIEMKES